MIKNSMGRLASVLIFLFPQFLAAEEASVDTGTTAWMLTSTALVLLMVPGLAMFYGGLVRTKNVLGTMIHWAFKLWPWELPLCIARWRLGSSPLRCKRALAFALISTMNTKGWTRVCTPSMGMGC